MKICPECQQRYEDDGLNFCLREGGILEFIQFEEVAHKYCPTCSKVYDDEKLNYCLREGTPLMPYPSQPQQQSSGNFWDECRQALGIEENSGGGSFKEQMRQLGDELRHNERANYFDQSTLAKVTELMDFYHPNNGRLVNWWRRGKAESGNKLAQVLNETGRLILEQGAMLAEHVLQGKIKQIQFEQFLAQHQYALFEMKAHAQLIENALSRGLTLVNDQHQKMEEHRFKLWEQSRLLEHQLGVDIRELEHQFRITELEVASKIERKRMKSALKNNIKLLKAMSRFKIDEAREIGESSLRFRLDEWNEKVRLAVIAKDEKMADYNKRVMVQGLVDECLKQIEEIKTNPIYLPDTKQRMIEYREEMIEYFTGKGKNLLLV